MSVRVDGSKSARKMPGKDGVKPGGLLFEVRQPLDLLAYPEIIPGAQRIPPKEVLERPSLIPKEKEAVGYVLVRMQVALLQR